MPAERLREAAVRAGRFMLGSAFVERTHRLEDTVVVLGCGRSGTTWLGDLLSLDPPGRSIFEPFDPDRVRGARAFGYREYLSPAADRPELRAAAERILTGRVRSVWSDAGNQASGRPARRVVKEIRGCLFAGWLRREFPEPGFVFIVRHPLENAGSRLRLGWPTSCERFIGQEGLQAAHPDLVEAVLSAKSTLARHVALWALDNGVDLRQLAEVDRPVVVTSHEWLVEDLPAELARVRAGCGLGPSLHIEPTLLPRGDVPSGSVTDAAAATRLGVGLQDVQEARSLLERLEVGALYGDRWSPDRVAFEQLSRSR